MSASVNCPNCGSTLAPGATACARCGHQLSDPASAETPPAGPQAPRSAPAAAPAQIKLNVNLSEMLHRWGVQRTTYATAAFVAAAVTVAIASIGVAIYLPAGSFDTQQDGQSFLTSSIGAGFITVALMALARWQSGGGKGGANQDDLRVSYALGGLALLWALMAVIVGFFDDRVDPEYGWAQYGLVFALLDLAWCTIARPIPESLGATKSINVGLGFATAAGVALLLGLFLAMSNSQATYSKGVTLQDVGFVLAVLSFGTFAGLPPRERA
jgi:hypothetical protein